MKKLRDFSSLVLNLTDGYKTKIGATIIFIGGGSLALKWIDETAFKVIEAFGLAVTAYGLRDAIRKVLEKE